MDPCDIEQTEVSTSDERIILDIQTFLNSNVVEQLDVTQIRWIYTILGTQVLESGPPDRDTLDRVMVSQFRNRDTVCEMRQSQAFVRESESLRAKAYTKSTSFLARDILDGKKISK